ncbi:hypothetical protein Q73A0000_05565 [Kaistella flava (ex Peng et al. 2021)]|uniref:Uncharacterized protein n=1 Tax=Kaistella flava (ex Peng et al. 2021) TaxID=2038776 RepID=A0A7M2Y6J3_9FLAO|nr:hypothetical protein [Kaistella flava (ex Peng et al. 2021)]QOW09867.1 hypothetical protein Q73A0000_05565 [Kaistella flava (ex Peng et al. 2021)]
MKKLLFLVTLFTFTVSVFGQTQENLKTHWAEEYKWKIGSNQEDNSSHMIELLSGNETFDNWTILGTMMSYKNVKISNTDQIVELYRKASIKESPKAKLAILETNETAKNIWVLFKVETPSFPNDPKPESQLYYATQGETTLYVNFIAIKEKKLSKDFVEKWSKVFKDSEFVYQ